jgi:hypothetical protein
MTLRKMLAITLSLAFMSMLNAGEIFVDVDNGNDGSEGVRTSPLKTFPSALNKALPGDTIFILPVNHPINASLVIRNKKGVPDKPIIIDGMMNTFVGTRPVSENDWQEVNSGTGLYRRQIKNARNVSRYFMCFNGMMERMGRHTKWKGAAPKKPEELKDYEWTIVGKSDFYFKIPAGMKLSGAQVEEPLFESGVKMYDECAHLVVRNLIVRQFWNDGYNIHNNCRDILFENIAALENSDDGVSAHETCQVKVKNMVSISNGTGFCHVQQAECDHENIYIADSDSRDIYLLNSVNRLKNVIVEGNAPGNMEFRTGKATLADCRFLNIRPGVQLSFLQCDIQAENVLFSGYATGKDLPAGFTSVSDPALLRQEIAASRNKIMAIFAGKLNLKPVQNAK